MPSGARQSDIITRLRHKIQRCSLSLSDAEAPEFSTGYPRIDRLLPGGCLRRGMVMEWLSPGLGSGAWSLSMHFLSPLISPDRTCVFVDEHCVLFPPRLKQTSFGQSRSVVLRPKSADLLWALEQTLRCSGVSVVFCQLDHLPITAARRLKLAAEESGTVCMLHRSTAMSRSRTWADSRLLVEPVAQAKQFRRRWRITVLYCRGGRQGDCIEVDVNDETDHVRVVSDVFYTADSVCTS